MVRHVGIMVRNGHLPPGIHESGHQGVPRSSTSQRRVPKRLGDEKSGGEAHCVESVDTHAGGTDARGIGVHAVHVFGCGGHVFGRVSFVFGVERADDD